MTPIRAPHSCPSKSVASSPSKSSPTSPGASKINKLLKDELQSIAWCLSPNPHSTARTFTCPLSEPPSWCRGVIHMYHGGFSDEPVCGITHPMFMNLGQFYTFMSFLIAVFFPLVQHWSMPLVQYSSLFQRIYLWPTAWRTSYCQPNYSKSPQ